ncbi:MAG: AbrB/MazE/SpoVT family DNA-binding domain-containing protein [Desulfurococcales archaeon]|nr:AbrB/MazE/SpoVT family DNA-binding domain-containing protein [Desulfurococcales archaeon]
MSIEVRRVQRLGASSLVVTIPKEWARRLGLEAGSRVYLIDEGDSVRIVPLSKSSGEPPEFVAPPIPKAAGDMVVCIYLSGLSEARIKLRGPLAGEALMALKERALSLLGVQVGESEDGAAVVKVALDSEKLDVPHMIRVLARDAEGILGILSRIVERGGSSEEDLRELEVLERDFLRNQHAIIRYLMTRRAGTPNLVANYYAALATGYLGFAVDLLDNMVKLLPEQGGLTLQAEEASRIKGLLSRLVELISLEARIIANPSFTRAGELIAELSSLRGEVRELISGSPSPWAAVVLAKIHDVLRVLTLSAYVTLCMAVISSAGRGKH